MRKRGSAALVMLAWLALAFLHPEIASAQDPCDDPRNLTLNCQFDTFTAAPGGEVPEGWWPFVISGHPAFDRASDTPKYPALRIWSDGEGFLAGIYQEVSGVTPGATYEAYIGWCAFASAGPEMGRAIGIDPAGGTDPNGAGIAWSSEVWEKKRLSPELRVRVVAQAEKITVFVRINHPRSYGADQAFLDAASLVRDDSVPLADVTAPLPAQTETTVATQLPAITDTPLPVSATETPVAVTVTPMPAPTDTATAAPTETTVPSPTVTPSPPPTATPTATLTRMPSATPTDRPTVAQASPSAWDLRAGTGVVVMAFAATAVAPAILDASVGGAAATEAGAVWPALVGGMVVVGGALAFVRWRSGGRENA